VTLRREVNQAEPIRHRTPRLAQATNSCADGGLDESHVVVAVSLSAALDDAVSRASAPQATGFRDRIVWTANWFRPVELWRPAFPDE
jgi:hypothetical protein